MSKLPSLGMCKIKDMRHVVHLVRPIPWLRPSVWWMSLSRVVRPTAHLPHCDLSGEEVQAHTIPERAHVCQTVASSRKRK